LRWIRNLGIVCVMAAVAVFCAQAAVASAKTIVVRPHHSIQAAINKSKPGDTRSGAAGNVPRGPGYQDRQGHTRGAEGGANATGEGAGDTLQPD
jgi:hypothetical protein